MKLSTGVPRCSDVRLLPVGSVEAADVESMAREIWPVAYAGIIPLEQIEFMLQWMYSPSKLIEEMTQEKITYFWISSGDTNAGFIAAGPSAEEDGVYQLHKFYVLPDWQHLGIGSLAMRLLIDQLIPIGVSRLELRVNRNNTSAIAFYRKNNFEVYAADCREIGDGFFMDDYLLRQLIPEGSSAREMPETIR